jgi:hypothetical protein
MNKAMSRVQAITGKISSLLKHHNNASSFLNSPTNSDDRHLRLSRLISVVSLTLLLLLSVPTLVLKAYSYSFIESNAEMGFYLVNDEAQGVPEGEVLVAALPHNIYRAHEKLVLIVAMLNALLSMAHLGFVVWDWKAGRRVSYLCHLHVQSEFNQPLDTYTRLPPQCHGSTHHEYYPGLGCSS